MTKPKPQTKITWTSGRVKLSELKAWDHNPRQISKTQAAQLARSIDELGQVETLAISANNELYNGHQRLAVLLKKYGGDYEVDVRISSRRLTEKERKKLVAFLHTATGSWDWDVLSSWDATELAGWGFNDEYKIQLGRDVSGIASLLQAEKFDSTGGALDTSPQMGSLQYRIVVTCNSEQEQIKLLSELEGKGVKCQALIS